MIKNKSGQRIEKAYHIGNLFKKNYQNFFTEDTDTGLWQDTKNTFPKIKPDLVMRLDNRVANEEIRQAIFDMAPQKAPGRMVSPQDSIKNCSMLWEIVFAGILERCGINQQALVKSIKLKLLIPKVNHPSHVH